MMVDMQLIELKQSAFTLIEMLVVLAIIAILATIAIPNNSNRTVQLQVVESIDIAENYKANIEQIYMLTGAFPSNNDDAGLPNSDEIRGNYLAGLRVQNGVLNLEFGQKMSEQHHGKVLSIRPVFVDSEAITPISWICGSDTIPEGMLAADENSTTLEEQFLPIRCR